MVGKGWMTIVSSLCVRSVYFSFVVVPILGPDGQACSVSWCLVVVKVIM